MSFELNITEQCRNVSKREREKSAQLSEYMCDDYLKWNMSAGEERLLVQSTNLVVL